MTYEITHSPNDITWKLRQYANDLFTNGPNICRRGKKTEQPNLDVLLKLAESGLTFSCQVFCQENNIVYSHTDDPSMNPIALAIENGDINLAIKLCRDTLMSPHPVVQYNRVPNDVLEYLLLNDIKRLDHHLTLKEDNDDTLFKFCNEMKINGLVIKFPPASVWIKVAKLGLQSIFHRITQVHLIEKDHVLEFSSGFTMMHYAAAYGQVSIIKSLLWMGHSPEMTGVYGLTPYHLSVLRLHHEVIACFQLWATEHGATLGQTILGLHLPNLVDPVRLKIGSSELLSDNDKAEILSESSPLRKRYVILAKTFHSLKKHNLENLLQPDKLIIENEIKLIADCKAEVTHFLTKLSADSVSLRCTLFEQPSLTKMNSLNRFLEFAIDIDRKNFMRHKFIEGSNLTSIMIKSFQESAKTLIVNRDFPYKTFDSQTIMSYPFTKNHEQGIFFYMSKQQNNQFISIKCMLCIRDVGSTRSRETVSLGNMSKVSFISTTTLSCLTAMDFEYFPCIRSVALRICLILCCSTSDSACYSPKLSLRLSRELNEHSPSLLGLNLGLAAAVLRSILPSTTQQSTDQRLHLVKCSKITNHEHSRSDLLNDTTNTEDEDLSSSYEETPDFEEMLYSEVVALVEAGIQRCCEGSCVRLPESVHPRDYDVLKQTLLAVKNFLKTL